MLLPNRRKRNGSHLTRTIPPRRTGEPKLYCKHLGQATGSQAAVICKSCNNVETTRLFPIFTCSQFGECLPSYRCTAEDKQAVSSRITVNGEPAALATCWGCPHSPLYAAVQFAPQAPREPHASPQGKPPGSLPRPSP